MEEYKNPKHRLMFYEAMLIEIESKVNRDTGFEYSYGLCKIMKHVSFHNADFVMEWRATSFEDLPELLAQKPSQMYSEAWWWYHNAPAPRINALNKAIELVKQQIH